MLEENGVNISGGQRQRIILARTLMKKSNILLIDEGLNEIDINLERKILKNIFKYFKEKTIIIVSHRVDNLDLYDKVIVVLDNTLSLVEHIEGISFSYIDVYNSELLNKMNKTMQLLTIITVLPLPITVVSGIFGMNFDNMPLKTSEIGFIISFSLIVILTIVEIIYIRKKKDL